MKRLGFTIAWIGLLTLFVFGGVVSLHAQGSASDGFNLVSTGTTPRQQLTLQWTDQEIRYEVHVEMTMALGPLGETKTIMEMDVGFQKIQQVRNGDTQLRVTFYNPSGILTLFGVENPIPALQRLHQAYFTMTASPQGNFRDIQLSPGLQEILQDQNISVTDQFLRFFLALPDEPIGRGAIWKNEFELPINLHYGALLTKTIQTVRYNGVTRGSLAEFMVSGTIQARSDTTSENTGNRVRGSGEIAGTVRYDTQAKRIVTSEIRQRLNVTVDTNQQVELFRLIQVRLH
jgi:hypothetical protein